MSAAFSRRTTCSPGAVRPVVTMGTPNSMQVAVHRSVMPRPIGMMLTPNGLDVRRLTAAMSALGF